MSVSVFLCACFLFFFIIITIYPPFCVSEVHIFPNDTDCLKNSSLCFTACLYECLFTTLRFSSVNCQFCLISHFLVLTYSGAPLNFTLCIHNIDCFKYFWYENHEFVLDETLILFFLFQSPLGYLAKSQKGENQRYSRRSSVPQRSYVKGH